jgi:Fanconi anemia group M protein
MSEFVIHPLIREGIIQSRDYQQNILDTAMEKNTLCVLPTGLGKTPIAVMLTVKRLEKFPESKILILAPTRPLVNQHYQSFIKAINLEEDRFVILTGVIKPDNRGEIYQEKQIIFATPQTIRNDIVEGRLSLEDFSLLVLDETHHAIGEYAYPYIAEKYRETAKHQRILGLTASPGSSRGKIREICKNIGIEAVEVRTETDEDVTPYVKQKETVYVYVELPPSFINIRNIINEELNKRVNTLRKLRFLRSTRTSKKELLSLQKSLVRGMKEGNKKALLGMSFVTQAIKLEHASTLLETQGITVLEKYWKKLRDEKTNTNKKLISNKNISNAMFMSNSLFEQGSKHPKIGKLCTIVHEQLREKKESKIIIFANYRESVKEIVRSLRGIENANPIEFIGQREGMTQKEQNLRLEDFREGKHNVLVCTSIGEEGLDIPEMDLALFYEPVPSGIRSVQRRGRVGRQRVGKIVILITRGTRDEAYYWTAKKKEQSMHRTLQGMQMGQKDISDF